MDEQLKIKLRDTIEASVRNFFHNKKIKVTHVLDKVFPAERRIRSLIGGLETSLGTTVWEPIAKLLAAENGYTLLPEELLMPDPFPKVLSEQISELKLLREKKESWIPMKDCVERLKATANTIDRKGLDYIPPPRGKGIDIYLSKNGKEYVFDIKTVQINQGAGLGLNLQLLEWYAFRLCKDPSVQFEARIAFPFNPFKRDWWKTAGSRAFPLQEGEDAWVENEFWDFCSGREDTWQEILQIFDELGQENFGKQFQDVFYPTGL